jgi:acyl transferase domain-containing protein
VGSVKANLGHTEPTAGLAGLIKSVMILEKGVIPPTPTHQQLSQDVAVALEGSIIQVS